MALGNRSVTKPTFCLETCLFQEGGSLESSSWGDTHIGGRKRIGVRPVVMTSTTTCQNSLVLSRPRGVVGGRLLVVAFCLTLPDGVLFGPYARKGELCQV